MIAAEYCTPERIAYFIEVVRAISGDGLNPGFGRVTEDGENGFTISLTIFNSHVERFAKAWPNLVEEERQRLASGIDARQRPDPAEGLDPEGESPVANGETPKA